MALPLQQVSIASEEGIMRVKDLMSEPVVTVAPAESGLDAVARMVRMRVRHLPVVNRDGMLVGVVTDRDLRHYLLAPHVFGLLPARRVEDVLGSVRVAEVMSTDVLTVEPEAILADAAAVMHDERVGSLPVVDHGRLVGVLTETDMLRHLVGVGPGCGPECAEIIVSFP
jgi:acetoin utilization protein AcuB